MTSSPRRYAVTRAAVSAAIVAAALVASASPAGAVDVGTGPIDTASTPAESGVPTASPLATETPAVPSTPEPTSTPTSTPTDPGETEASDTETPAEDTPAPEAPVDLSTPAPATGERNAAPSSTPPPAGSPAAAETYYDALVAGEHLVAGEEITSENSTFRFVLQSDGNAVVYDSSSRARWNSGTRGSGNHLEMQSDGNVVIYSSGGRALWTSGTAGNPDSDLVIQSDGNLVVYRYDGSPSWSSVTGRLAPPPRVQIPAGTRLDAGSSLVSPDRRYRADVQSDGNFVVYGPNGAIWSTRTSGSGVHLDVQRDGNVVLYTGSNGVLWASYTRGDGVSLELQNDGNLVVYNAARQAIWHLKAFLTVDTLYVRDTLAPGEQMVSANRQYRAVMQSDGNFVIYGPSGPIWQTDSHAPNATFRYEGSILSVNASYYFRDASWVVFLFDNTTRLILQNDGNLVAYLPDGRASWSSVTGSLPFPFIRR